MNRKVWTSDELSDDERRELFRASIIWERDQIPAHLLEDAQRFIAEREGRAAS